MNTVFEANLIVSDLYQFEIEKLKDKTFSIISFSGAEQLCKSWCINIVAAGPAIFEDLNHINTDTIINSSATLQVKTVPSNDKLYYTGLISTFEVITQMDIGIFLYQIKLESPLAAMMLNKKEKSFMAITPNEIIQYMVKAYPQISFETKLSKTDYPVKSTIPQSGESDYDFIHRVMEHWGIYYSFDLSAKEKAKVIITDSNPDSENSIVTVNFGKYGDSIFDKSTLYQLSHQMKRVPASVSVKDYNYRIAKTDINSVETVQESGIGSTVYYNQDAATAEEAKTIASLRAERLKCDRETFKGTVSTPQIRPGGYIQPGQHPLYTETYLIFEMEFNGSCASMLKEKYKTFVSNKDTDPVYSCEFKAIHKDTVFRPKISTPIPNQQSIVTGTIANKKNFSEDPKSDDDFITENGEFLWKDARKDYHLKENIEEHSTVRNSTPDIGSKHETSFPLKHADEVAVSFERGNLSRPTIVNSLFNSNNESPVTSANNHSSIMDLPGNNKIIMTDDDSTDQGIIIKADQHDSYIAMGDIKETRDEKGTEKSWFDFVTDPIDYGIVLKTDENLIQKTKKEEEEFWQQSLQYTTGTTLDVVLGYHGVGVLGLNTAIALGVGTKFNLADLTKVNEAIEKFVEHKIDEILDDAGLGEEEATAETIRTDLGIDRNQAIATAVEAKMTEANAYVERMNQYVERIRVSKEKVEAQALRSSQILDNLAAHEDDVKTAIVSKKDQVVLQTAQVNRQAAAPLISEVAEVEQVIEAVEDDCRFFGIIGE